MGEGKVLDDGFSSRETKKKVRSSLLAVKIKMIVGYLREATMWV